VAAGLVMAGGLASTMMAGTAFAGPIIFATTTSITGTSQAQQSWSNDPVVTVKFSVTAGGGNSAPGGSVTVNVAGRSASCHASLGSNSGLTSSGSCELSGLAPGSYTLQANYAGGSQMSKSASSDYSLKVGPSSGQGSTVTTRLRCPAAVNAGQSGSCDLTVTNKGPGTADNVVAEIALPSQLKARYCGNDWWWNAGCSVRSNDATWRLGNLRPWQSKSLTVHFTAAGNRWTRHASLVTVTGTAAWAGPWQNQGPMRHISVSKYRVEIRPWGFVF
jgi:Bacterial Ig-like domain (group 3)/Domain of unknown function DUF11